MSNEAEICALYRSIGYCDSYWLEDGAIRFTVASSPHDNCCEIERFNLSEHKISYRVRACTQPGAGKVSCKKFEKTMRYADLFYIDGKILTTVEAEKGTTND